MKVREYSAILKHTAVTAGRVQMARVTGRRRAGLRKKKKGQREGGRGKRDRGREEGMESKQCCPLVIQECRDFSGGAVVDNPPANAGDMGSSPGPGRSHMPWSY